MDGIMRLFGRSTGKTYHRDDDIDAAKCVACWMAKLVDDQGSRESDGAGLMKGQAVVKRQCGIGRETRSSALDRRRSRSGDDAAESLEY